METVSNSFFPISPSKRAQGPVIKGTSLIELLGTEYGKKYDFTWKLMHLERSTPNTPLPIQFKPLPDNIYHSENKE